MKRRATCRVCLGPITYYPRRQDDPKPRTASIDDAQRWAHDRLADFIKAPHRALPADAAVA